MSANEYGEPDEYGEIELPDDWATRAAKAAVRHLYPGLTPEAAEEDAKAEYGDARVVRDIIMAEFRADWQPIDTAPKDGTWILGANYWDVMKVRWMNHGWEEYNDIRPTFSSPPLEITHWRPLPDPPKRHFSVYPQGHPLYRTDV